MMSFEEFKKEEMWIYVLFIDFLLIAHVTSYLKLSILNVVDWFLISINLWVNDKIMWLGEFAQGSFSTKFKCTFGYIFIFEN